MEFSCYSCECCDWCQPAVRSRWSTQWTRTCPKSTNQPETLWTCQWWCLQKAMLPHSDGVQVSGSLLSLYGVSWWFICGKFCNGSFMGSFATGCGNSEGVPVCSTTICVEGMRTGMPYQYVRRVLSFVRCTSSRLSRTDELSTEKIRPIKP